MDVEKLTKLANLLDTISPERFDYTRWAGADWQGLPDLSCGTTACAAGWATTIPEFRAEGFRLEQHRGGGYGYGSSGPSLILERPNRLKQYGIEACAVFFGLSEHEANHLFMPRANEGHAAPKDVADKIRKLISDGEDGGYHEECNCDDCHAERY